MVRNTQPDDIVTANLGYALPWVQGLSVRAGTSYVSKRYVGNAQQGAIPAVNLYSAGAAYNLQAWGKRVALQLNIDKTSKAPTLHSADAYMTWRPQFISWLEGHDPAIVTVMEHGSPFLLVLLVLILLLSIFHLCFPFLFNYLDLSHYHCDKGLGFWGFGVLVVP